MTDLETRIREHYDPKDHPSVFELLDVVKDNKESAIGLGKIIAIQKEDIVRLLTAIQEAPHAEGCGGWFEHSPYLACDCWKSKVLENPND